MYKDVVQNALQQWYLMKQLTRREIVGRYRGSWLGLAWSLFHPLLMLSVYTFVFSIVFRTRWDMGEDESRVEFAIVLFVGLIVHGLFAECANRSCDLISAHTHFVKKVRFPLVILPLVVIGSAIFHAAVSLLVLFAAMVLSDVTLHSTIFYLPLILFPLLLIIMGLSWFLAATAVFVRDLGQVVPIATSMLLFLSPIFFPLSAVPPDYQAWIMLNPLTFVIEQARGVIIWGVSPDWLGLLLFDLAGLVGAGLGFWWFQRCRKGFADVL